MLLAAAVDYAGLFPPAACSMSEAVAEYQRALSGPDAWMLGRFVVPAARLAELQAAQATGPTPRLAPGRGPQASAGRGSRVAFLNDDRLEEPWRISAILRDGSEADRSAITEFNARSTARAVVDAVECKPESVQRLDWLTEGFGHECEIYVEVAAAADAPLWLERIAARGLRAKVRTGGLTPDAFPSPDDVLAFIAAAVRLRVPFKATAGLHHAIRGAYPLTYSADAAHATMYGYLNVLLATAALREGLPLSAAADLLQRADAASLLLADGAVRWGDVQISATAIRHTRAEHLTSFGSCSFREPADEYHGLIVPVTSPARD
jgi:hypothetical protein